METLESLTTGAGEIQNQNKIIVSDFFTAIDNQDFGRLNELLSDDFLLKAAGLKKSWKKEDVFHDIMKFFTAFPDWKHSIEELVAEGDKVSVQVSQRGTHQAQYEETKPTGKEITKPAIHIFTIKNCMIKECWSMEEELGFMLQLGMELRRKDDLDIENIEADLRSYESNHRSAIEKKDIEEILQFYAPDLIIIPQGEPNIYGQDQLKNLLVELFKTYDLFEDFKFAHIRVTGDRITASYTFEQKLTPFSGGDMIYRTGKGLCILKRSGTGNWQSEWNSYNYDGIPETGNGQTRIVDIEKEKLAVSERVDQLFRAIETEDAEMLENIFCDDTDLVFFGTDANERWIGKEAFIAAQKEVFKVTTDSKMEVYNKAVQLSQSGTVAWTSCMMNWDILSGDQPIHQEGLRLTLTFEKRNENWIIVQGHGSVPVSGQMIAY
jgi:uncharacterized protein (TIGR02246 family)